MDKILELIEELAKLYPSYVVFTLTNGHDSRDGTYKKYKIYTPDIGHNEFKTLPEFTEFLYKLVNSKIYYMTRDKERIENRIKSAKESMAYAHEVIEEESKNLLAWKQEHADLFGAGSL